MHGASSSELTGQRNRGHACSRDTIAKSPAGGYSRARDRRPVPPAGPPPPSRDRTREAGNLGRALIGGFSSQKTTTCAAEPAGRSGTEALAQDPPRVKPCIKYQAFRTQERAAFVCSLDFELLG